MPPRAKTDRPVKNDTPPNLRAYIFHGVDLRWRDGQPEALAECPFCGRDKLYVNVETGLGQCKTCLSGSRRGGINHLLFVRMMWELGFRGKNDYGPLARDRGVEEDTLRAWGVCRSPSTGDWAVPGYDRNGAVCQLYRYCRVPGENRMALLATPGLGHGLLRPIEFEDDEHHQELYVCEGPWDGMGLWEAMGRAKRGVEEGSLEFTGNPKASLLSGALVCSTPAATVFHDSWASLAARRDVKLMYDNDWPRKVNGGKEVDGAGVAGVKLVCGRLTNADEKARSVSYLNWGELGVNPGLSNGHDVRDELAPASGNTDLVWRLTVLLNRVQPVPAGWVPGRDRGGVAGSTSMEVLPCEHWQTVRDAAIKAFRWNEGLDRGLSVMLAAITSVQSTGDQLWVKIVSPPSGGKSSLCEALAVNKDHVRSISALRGFHSGYKTDKEGADDHSLIAELKRMSGGRGAALVTKDGDTLLQSPNLGQILSEARDIYDRTSRSHYRHGVSREYTGLNMTWILCGTSSLRTLDQSELGERFLDCVIIDKIDREEERRTAIRKAYTAKRQLSVESNGSVQSSDTPEMVKFKRLVGGYVGHLWNVSISAVDAVAMSEDRYEECVDLGEFVANMRARPSTKQKEKAERELSYRLTSQFVRLANCLAVVLNRDEVDDEVMRRTRRVALDTARGRTFVLAQELFRVGPGGAEARGLRFLINETDAETVALLKFLKDIEVAEPFRRPTGLATVQGAVKWRLTEHFTQLWERVVGSGQ